MATRNATGCLNCGFFFLFSKEAVTEIDPREMLDAGCSRSEVWETYVEHTLLLGGGG